MMSPVRLRVINGFAVLLRGVFRLLGGFRVVGLENLPVTGAAILAPNHRSWADPPAVRISNRRVCWFMANHFLFNLPLFGPVIRLFGAFPVERGTMDRDALRRAEQHLKDGELVCIFPEGGTTVTGTLYPFEGGVALLALRNDVPVVPVALTGTDSIWPDPRRLPRYAKGGVTVTFGKPIYPAEIDPELPRRERVDRLTRRMYDAVATLLPPEYVPADWQSETAAERVQEAAGSGKQAES